MKFAVEIYGNAADGSELLLHRSTVWAITSWGTLKEARREFLSWKKRGAKNARVLNGYGEVLHTQSE